MFGLMSKHQFIPWIPVQTKYRSTGMRPQRGFTLVELLVVIVIMGALMAAAVPALGAITDSMKLSSQSSVYFSSLHQARSEAIKRNSRVTLCTSADGSACAESGGWHQGWIIFHDANNNGARESGETVIHQVQALPARSRLVGNLNVAKYVSFSPTGGTQLVSGAFQAGTLTLCHESASGGEARQIILNALGRPRVQKMTVSACV